MHGRSKTKRRQPGKSDGVVHAEALCRCEIHREGWEALRTEKVRVSGTSIWHEYLVAERRLSPVCRRWCRVWSRRQLTCRLIWRKRTEWRVRERSPRTPVEWIALSRAAMRPDGLDCDHLRSDGQRHLPVPEGALQQVRAVAMDCDRDSYLPAPLPHAGEFLRATCSDRRRATAGQTPTAASEVGARGNR